MELFLLKFQLNRVFYGKLVFFLQANGSIVVVMNSLHCQKSTTYFSFTVNTFLSSMNNDSKSTLLKI